MESASNQSLHMWCVKRLLLKTKERSMLPLADRSFKSRPRSTYCPLINYIYNTRLLSLFAHTTLRRHILFVCLPVLNVGALAFLGPGFPFTKSDAAACKPSSRETKVSLVYWDAAFLLFWFEDRARLAHGVDQRIKHGICTSWTNLLYQIRQTYTPLETHWTGSTHTEYGTRNNY